jgi:hypothetical protein
MRRQSGRLKKLRCRNKLEKRRRLLRERNIQYRIWNAKIAYTVRKSTRRNRDLSSKDLFSRWQNTIRAISNRGDLTSKNFHWSTKT